MSEYAQLNAQVKALQQQVLELQRLVAMGQTRPSRGIPINSLLTQGRYAGALSGVLDFRDKAVAEADQGVGICLKNRCDVLGTTGEIGELYLFHVTQSNGDKVFVSGYGW